MFALKEKMERYLPALLVGVLVLVVPDVAFAIDLKDGADAILGLLQTILIIAVLGFAAMSFFKGEMVKCIVCAIVGGILLAVANVAALKAIGDAIINLFK